MRNSLYNISAIVSSSVSLPQQTCLRCQVARFSTTSPLSLKTADRNKNRGVSGLRRTGPRYPRAVSKEPLPQPVLDPARRSKIQVNEKHGLWDFFDKEKNPFEKPEVVAAHGRPWAVEELRHKSFEDLHCLWWVCVKEKNRILTQEHERERMQAGYGKAEAQERQGTIRKTMRAIKHVLTERWYAYEEARKIAEKDPGLKDYFEEFLRKEGNISGNWSEQRRHQTQVQKLNGGDSVKNLQSSQIQS
ncbi:MAG: hypothetical protein LQ340_006921 [Diploschistes diacapsis]|nr:MAG: hypothetical protein LQ340_006921 [Diploschistes diacapsis]